MSKRPPLAASKKGLTGSNGKIVHDILLRMIQRGLLNGSEGKARRKLRKEKPDSLCVEGEVNTWTGKHQRSRISEGSNVRI